MKLNTVFSAALGATLSLTAAGVSKANDVPVIPEHFYDRYGSNTQQRSSDQSKPGKLEQLFKDGTVLSRESGGDKTSIKIRSKSIGIEWEREF